MAPDTDTDWPRIPPSSIFPLFLTQRSSVPDLFPQVAAGGAPLSRTRKVLLVAGGYGFALVVALVVTKLYILATDTPDRQSSAGMYAFGDTMFFVGVFALAAVPATALALYFLRSVPRLWLWASATAVGVATTAVGAMLTYLLRTPGATTNTVVMLAPIRILLAPVLGLGYFLGLVFAPTRESRRLLLAATAMELGAFVVVVLIWWGMSR